MCLSFITAHRSMFSHYCSFVNLLFEDGLYRPKHVGEVSYIYSYSTLTF